MWPNALGWPGSNGLWEEVGLGAEGESITYEPNMSLGNPRNPQSVEVYHIWQYHCISNILDFVGFWGLEWKY